MQDSRGQNLKKLRDNVRKGEIFEGQMKAFMYAKFGITLIQNTFKFSSYDFTISGYPNILIEYKALSIKKVIYGKPCIYPFIIIPKCKVDSFTKIQEEALKKNQKKHFIYLISFCYEIEGIRYKQHEFVILDLENIKKHCNIITNVLNNAYDTAPHYQINHNNFKPIDMLHETLDLIQKQSNKFEGDTSKGLEQSKGSTNAPENCDDANDTP